MKRQDYYPGIVEEQVLWLGRFAAALPRVADTLTLPAQEVADGVADARWVAYTIGPWRAAVRSFSKSSTAAMEAVQTGTGAEARDLPAFIAPPRGDAVPRPPGALKRIFSLVQRIKANLAYQDAIGHQLGILTIADDRQHPAPSLTVEAVRGQTCEEAVLKMEKWGHVLLHIEGRRGGGDWERLALTSQCTFTDARPLLSPTQPEIREYRVRYYENSGPTGEWSPVVRITLSP
jgi:hypothetical protein